MNDTLALNCPVPHTSSPSRFTLKKMATTPLNPEYEAFQRCSADLIRGVQYPEALTWEMYFDNILSEAVVDEVSTVGLSTVQRRIKLLSAVRAEIATDPTKFQKLFQTLRRQPSLKDVAEKLNATYVHHLKVDSRETGLKGLSCFDYHIVKFGCSMIALILPGSCFDYL